MLLALICSHLTGKVFWHLLIQDPSYQSYFYRTENWSPGKQCSQGQMAKPKFMMKWLEPDLLTLSTLSFPVQSICLLARSCFLVLTTRLILRTVGNMAISDSFPHLFLCYKVIHEEIYSVGISGTLTKETEFWDRKISPPSLNSHQSIPCRKMVTSMAKTNATHYSDKLCWL